MHTIFRTSRAAALAGLLILATAATAAAETPPRPGCGYGDENHAHQAAPGRDPMGLRPGDGRGDDQHDHTLPPGQAPAGGGDQSGPMRGCNADPSGHN